MVNGEVGSLESEALKRKERLQELKRKRANESSKLKDGETPALPKPVFRSYIPADDKLQEQSLPQEKPVEVKELFQEDLENAQSKMCIDEVDLVNLAPRKPDWDLKRDIAAKMEKLEHRTQHAIAELIRERLKNDQGNLADAVNVGAAAAANDVED